MQKLVIRWPDKQVSNLEIPSPGAKKMRLFLRGRHRKSARIQVARRTASTTPVRRSGVIRTRYPTARSQGRERGRGTRGTGKRQRYRRLQRLPRIPSAAAAAAAEINPPKRRRQRRMWRRWTRTRPSRSNSVSQFDLPFVHTNLGYFCPPPPSVRTSYRVSQS